MSDPSTPIRGVDQALFEPNPGTQDCNPPDLGFRALVAEDLRTHEGDWLSLDFWALIWQRFGNWRKSVRQPLRAPLGLLYRMIYRVGQRSGGIMLPYTVGIGPQMKLEHFGGKILIAQTIGHSAIVGANPVVTKSMPAGAVVGGIPARLIRMRDPAELGRHD